VLYTRAVISMQNMRESDQEKILYPWFARCSRTCIDATGLGIGWADDAQDKFGEHRIEAVTFTPKTKEALAYPVRGRMQDRTLRIPYDTQVRADLRSVTKQTTAAGNIRFTAESTPDGHADRFWALALAAHAASSPAAEIDYQSAGTRASVVAILGSGFGSDGFGTVPGGNDFGGFA
jgi:phage FluMu gp28-like protein